MPSKTETIIYKLGEIKELIERKENVEFSSFEVSKNKEFIGLIKNERSG